MTKTEAAGILANRARVKAREGWNHGVINKDLVEVVMSKAPHWGGLFSDAAAAAASWRTVLRVARAAGDL